MMNRAARSIWNRETEKTNGSAEYDHWTRCVSHVFSRDALDILEQSLGKRDMGVVTVQIEDFYALVGVHGEDAGFRLLDMLREEATARLEVSFPGAELLAVGNLKINEVVVCLGLAEREVSTLASAALAYRIRIENGLNRRVRDFLGSPVEVLVGHSWISRDQAPGLARVLFKAFCDAKRVATAKPDPGRFDYHREFVEILTGPRLQCMYQPIADFRTGEVMGWEALVRPPEDSRFAEPCMLFGYAEEIGKVFALDKRCRETAVRDLGDIPPDRRLFLNIHMQSLNDPAFSPVSMLRLLHETRLTPGNIVFEFSEKYGIQDFSFLLECLDQYKRHGFGIALDNVGAGHSSLHSISQIRPDFIKIDMSLTRGIDFNPIKRVMVETFVTLSEKIGSKVIVAGIETDTELSSLVSMGVHFGQGRHIMKPSYPRPDIRIEIPKPISVHEMNSADFKCSMPVRALVQPALFVGSETTVKEVKELLEGRPPISSVVVVDGRAPQGLVMNYNLDRQLSTSYGFSLFYHRQVSKLMDSAPLVVDAGEAVEQVARSAMNRDDRNVYDDIIVTDNGEFMGIISVQKMLDTLARVQVEMAKGANPLTGLPGNVAIEQEINRRAAGKVKSSLIYVDLDNFKVYNDVYGFDNGDRVILFTSRVLGTAVAQEGGPGDFIGHVGGDDFVIATAWESAERICRAVATAFDAGIRDFYGEEDRRNGYVRGKGRDGAERRFPLVTVSQGIVECEFRYPFTMDELSLRMAEVKKYAKSAEGNTYVKDRRSALGSIPPDAKDPAPAAGLH